VVSINVKHKLGTLPPLLVHALGDWSAVECCRVIDTVRRRRNQLIPKGVSSPETEMAAPVCGLDLLRAAVRTGLNLRERPASPSAAYLDLVARRVGHLTLRTPPDVVPALHTELTHLELIRQIDCIWMCAVVILKQQLQELEVCFLCAGRHALYQLEERVTPARWQAECSDNRQRRTMLRAAEPIIATLL